MVEQEKQSQQKEHFIPDQSFKKEQLLFEKKKEIEELKKEIRILISQNRKKKLIRKLKISAKIGMIATPYILSAGISFQLFSVCGNTPFLIDKQKVYFKTEEVKEEYILAEEEFLDNLLGTILWLFVFTSGFHPITKLVVLLYSKLDLDLPNYEEYNEIIYGMNKQESLVKKLAIKKEDYNRFAR